jgi:hypothetical protein
VTTRSSLSCKYAAISLWIEKRFVDSPTQLEAVVSASLPRDSTRLRCGGESLATSTPASNSCYQIDTVEQAMHACATEARFRQLQGCDTTGIDVGKAAPDLRPKGTREQQHGAKRPGGLST